MTKFTQICRVTSRKLSRQTPKPLTTPALPRPAGIRARSRLLSNGCFPTGTHHPTPASSAPPSPDGPETTKSMRRDNLATIECVTYIGVTGHWTPCVGGGGAPGWWVGGGKGPCPDPLGFRPFRPAFAGNRGSGLVVGGYWAQGHACVENYHMSEICGAHSFWPELLDLEKNYSVQQFCATLVRFLPQIWPSRILIIAVIGIFVHH